MTTVYVVTSIDWPELFPGDHPFLTALREAGAEASVVLWDDPAIEWGAADAAVIRSVWDYTFRRDEFLAWIDRASAQTRLFNPPRVLRWNSHKGYLRDIERSGAPVVPTEWLDAGAVVDLGELLERRGWHDAVVKPAVSAGARRTIRVSTTDVSAGRVHLATLLEAEDVMVQPYLPEIEQSGERALIYFGGRFSHAVRKEPALAGGEYSSQEVTPVEPDPRERSLAEHVLAHIPERLLYARVDVVLHEDVAHVMELEVIEPQLYFADAPGSARRMTEALLKML
jgi:glutathione synthase/RimK-type ligase-like ATP-grasp enzyme